MVTGLAGQCDTCDTFFLMRGTGPGVKFMIMAITMNERIPPALQETLDLIAAEPQGVSYQSLRATLGVSPHTVAVRLCSLRRLGLLYPHPPQPWTAHTSAQATPLGERLAGQQRKLWPALQETLDLILAHPDGISYRLLRQRLGINEVALNARLKRLRQRELILPYHGSPNRRMVFAYPTRKAVLQAQRQEPQTTATRGKPTHQPLDVWW